MMMMLRVRAVIVGARDTRAHVNMKAVAARIVSIGSSLAQSTPRRTLCHGLPKSRASLSHSARTTPKMAARQRSETAVVRTRPGSRRRRHAGSATASTMSSATRCSRVSGSWNQRLCGWLAPAARVARQARARVRAGRRRRRREVVVVAREQARAAHERHEALAAGHHVDDHRADREGELEHARRDVAARAVRALSDRLERARAALLGERDGQARGEARRQVERDDEHEAERQAHHLHEQRHGEHADAAHPVREVEDRADARRLVRVGIVQLLELLEVVRAVHRCGRGAQRASAAMLLSARRRHAHIELACVMVRRAFWITRN